MIIFLDGPNGSGKDYTIERLEKAAKRLKMSFKTISFKETIEDPSLKSVIYKRKEEDVSKNGHMDIYNTHLKYIEIIKDLKTKVDVLVVNRFCPSFYVYQYRLPEVYDESINLSLVIQLTKKYAESFLFHRCVFLQLQDSSEVLTRRLLHRDKRIDILKHERLQKYYEVYNDTIAKYLPNVVVTRSEDIDPFALLTF